MAGKVSRKPNTFQKWIHQFLMMKTVSALISKVLHRADASLLYVTRGRYTFTGLAGLPIIQLTTIGARTRKARTLTLVGVPDHDRVILLATNFGQNSNPGWYYNLKAHPECQVQCNGTTKTFVARETSGDEYQRYWQLGVAYYAGYEKYKQRAAHRHIPIMVLEPEK
jgi:deazaflavin-dependent oxidoreductase (nitroreductase family)